MIYFDRHSKSYTFGDLIESKNNSDYCLGRKFASNIRKIDSRKIYEFREKVENIKLEIMDAAEDGRRPPVIKNVQWLYDLAYSSTYKFIYREFDTWMTKNGLIGRFSGSEDDREMNVYINQDRVDIGTSKELPDTTNALDYTLGTRRTF